MVLGEVFWDRWGFCYGGGDGGDEDEFCWVEGYEIGCVGDGREEGVEGEVEVNGLSGVD